ncbi:hypothetical protein EDI_203440 [Entamoeba dispar SAW760]|uniref:Uncharacterized protein n=1 Tax=Entamoeba dispar (strain ATCC PRA-260 / SAW760) TaxID=370354 RepID=B0E5D3_ENTDS|nr:uncharacterized protein EDI_203440 [Entamoeba dispar SAW760]EDR30266.1 hypothetical protein EDI_203440 [Entamoeba dispar SAW760]|eukprot:EDR30266.1 hypothetical protein EDI_203440 [Entamoeba dispar SAW760]
MSKRTVKATSQQALMKIQSTNKRRKYILSGCYYLITKGWSFLFSKEKRIAGKLDHFFPIQKIWNQNGVIMFDENLEYDLIKAETGVVLLNFDNKGIPIKKTSIEDKIENKKKLNYNELVIMNILNEYYNKYKDIGCNTKLLYTKSSKYGVSSQQYQKLPLVNKDGEVIGVYKNEEVLEKIGTPVYNFLCSYLLKTNTPQLKGLFKTLQQELDIISHSGSSENILSYNNIDSHFSDNQYTQIDNNVSLINVDPRLVNFENSNYNEAMPQNNPDFVDISYFTAMDCDSSQADYLSETSFIEHGFIQNICHYE